MKKTYMNPSMVVVRFSMSNIIAVSPRLGVTQDGDTYDLTDIDATDDEDAMTKALTDKNLWDEEW